MLQSDGLLFLADKFEKENDSWKILSELVARAGIGVKV